MLSPWPALAAFTGKQQPRPKKSARKKKKKKKEKKRVCERDDTREVTIT